MSVGFFFDMTRCAGCRTCQVACKDCKRLPEGVLYRRAATYTVGSFPKVQAFSMSFSCNHCARPACVAACPVGAMRQADDGTVLPDAEACVGCGSCVLACPYQVPQLLPDGTAGKCDGCFSLRAEGETPACVAACPMRALDFGEREELVRRHEPGLVSAVSVLPDGGTGSSTLIKAKEAAFESGPRELLW